MAGRGRVGGRSHPDSNAREEMMLICGCRRRARARTASTSLPSSLGAREVGTVRSPARAAGVDLARTHLQLQRRSSGRAARSGSTECLDSLNKQAPAAIRALPVSANGPPKETYVSAKETYFLSAQKRPTFRKSAKRDLQ